MICGCNQEAKLLETKKPGPNQGRKFWACARPQGDQCDFFCWDGETPRQVSARTPGREELIGKVLANMSVKLDRILEMLEKNNLNAVKKELKGDIL